MCGLVGVAGDITAKEEKIYKELLLVSSLRGMHSTGTAFISREKDAEVMLAKGMGGPWNLLTHKSFKKGMACINKAFIGHNRFATVGSVERNNAHPFENESIVGAHNGTLINQTLLPDHKEFAVDSENIFHSFNIQGEEETIKNLDGAFALVWWNKKENRLKFLRNERRTLFYSYNRSRNILFWASEKEMLEFILERNNIFYDEIYIFNTKKIYSFELPDRHPRKILLEQKGVEFYKRPVFDYMPNYSENWITDWYGGRREERKEQERAPYFSGRIINKPAVIGAVRWKGQRDPQGEYSLNKKRRKLVAKGRTPKNVKGPGHLIFTQEQFDEHVLIAAGCCWCSVIPEYGDDIRYLKDNEYLCADCKDNPEIMQFAM